MLFYESGNDDDDDDNDDDNDDAADDDAAGGDDDDNDDDDDPIPSEFLLSGNLFQQTVFRKAPDSSHCLVPRYCFEGN